MPDSKVSPNHSNQPRQHHAGQSSEDSPSKTDFERASESQGQSFLAEFIDFLKHNKKWWMTPIFVVLALLAVLVVLSSSAAAPFIYSLF